MIDIQHGNKRFGKSVILEDIHFHVDQAGIYALIGESGCGKTTLLNIIAGFDSLSEGEITIDEKPAFIFQNYELIEELTVKENILLNNNTLSDEEESLIHDLGLFELLHSYPKELSGGQRQRVGIARALISNPSLILCDEPTESLDIDNKVIVMELLKKLSCHAVVVVVTHDQKMIQDYADCIFKIENKAIYEEKRHCPTDSMIKNIEKERVFDVPFIIRRILFRRNLVFSILFAILLVSWCGLYAYQQKMFLIPTTTNVLNKDMLYIKASNKENISSAFDVVIDDTNTILDFETMIVDDKEYRSNIFPFVSTKLQIEGNLPAKKQILINQNIKNQFNLKMNDEITLSYYLSSMQHSMDVTISGIVYEEDATSFNIYYHQKDIKEFLKDVTLSSGQSHFSYLTQHPEKYQLKVGYHNLEKYYELSKTNKDLKLSHPLFDYRQTLMEERSAYQFLYSCVIVIFLIGMYLFMVLFLTREYKYQSKNSAILASAGIPFNEVKKRYIISKVIIFYPLVLCVLIVVLGIVVWSLKDILLIKDYIVILAVICISFILYFVINMLCLRNWNSTKISSTLKEE